jgi:hypothetical protein
MHDDDEVNRRERRMRWGLRPLRGPCRCSVPWGRRVSVRSFSLDVNDVVSVVTYSVIRCPDDDDDDDEG